MGLPTVTVPGIGAVPVANPGRHDEADGAGVTLSTQDLAKLDAQLAELTSIDDNSATIAAAATSTNASDVNAFTPGAVLTIVPVLSTTPAYTSGDVLFATTAIPGFSRAADIVAWLVSLAVIDKSNQSPALTVDFFSANVTSGAANAVPSMSDADGANFLGSVSFVASDYKTRNGFARANKASITTVMQPATNTTIVYMVGYLDAGSPTFALGDLILRFGVAQ